MRYDFICDGCGTDYVASFPMGEAPETVQCPYCKAPDARRAWKAPQMIVRGVKKGGNSGEEFAPEHFGCDVPPAAKAAGYTSKSYEALHRKERKSSEAQKREIARRLSGGRHMDGGIRPVGEIPTAKFFAMMKENGGEVPTVDQLKTRDCLYEHEKGKV